MNLGERIKQLRNEQELTQPELAAKAGIEQSYLSKLENGKGTPSFDIIQRLALALDTTAMELIHSLELSYVQARLSHIPEVAAEYVSIKAQREQKLKTRFIAGAAMLVLGVGLYFSGTSALFFPDTIWMYQSDGVILEGEPVLQFQYRRINEIMETEEEARQRILANRTRFDRIFLNTHQFRGARFVEEVEVGRRYFELLNDRGGRQQSLRRENTALKIVGSMLGLAGLLTLSYTLLFGLFRKT